MISSRKLIKLAKKWQRLAAIRRRRITLRRIDTNIANANSCSTSSVAEKGHFVVYSTDQKCFVLPLEFGVPKEGYSQRAIQIGRRRVWDSKQWTSHIALRCRFHGIYVISLIKSHLTEEVKEALLISMAGGRCLSSSHLHQESRNQQSLVCSF